jgi:hypothetical protein
MKNARIGEIQFVSFNQTFVDLPLSFSLLLRIGEFLDHSPVQAHRGQASPCHESHNLHGLPPLVIYV